ncbi:hypothetical protein [Marinomonas sp. 2405UD68-3]|uniref:hypothetical protein n=1 Tax=Marinomonas sp. 2405UD68-3 TaxID=3391835 RepID=UPI0039C8D6A1
MKYLVLNMIIALFVSSVYAETVKTTDGRTIILNKDGTYQIVEIKSSANKAMLKVESHMFEHKTDKYSQKSIHFMPLFTNLLDKNVIAVKFTSQFLDPFGDVVLKINGNSEENIKPGGKSTANLLYVFKDNQFIGGENYDKLLSMVTNGTGSIKTNVTAIVIEGGEIIKL